MAVAPPFANLLLGMTKLRTRKPKSHPVHRGQADFVNSGTTTVKSLLLAVLSRLDRVKIRSGQDYPSGRRIARLKVLRSNCTEGSMLTEISIAGKQRHAYHLREAAPLLPVRMI
jgi:hypothetical protein